MTAPCDRSSLVEAAFDGRLGAPERLSLDRHLAQCAHCADERRELEELRTSIRALAGDVTPLEHQRARLRLLRGAAAPARTRVRWRFAVLATALVFLPALVWGAVSTHRSSRAPEPDEVLVTDPEPVPPLPVRPVVPPIVPVTPVVDEAPAPEAVAPPAPKLKSHASRDFADAMEAIARGDFGAGAARLERFAQENPTDPRAEEAVYLEAIALERAGRSTDARTVARRYLATYPDGAHVVHAQQISK